MMSMKLWTILLLIVTIMVRRSMGEDSITEQESFTSSNVSTDSTDGSTEDRIYSLNLVFAAGCPYTASWLLHINLFIKTKVWLDSTKMEAASFLIFGAAKNKFQVADSDAYYVHHMSRYEHFVHKTEGFEVAKNKTLIMSQAAYHGECSNLEVSRRREFLAVVPFYGGLPPNVTKDLSVKSIGQGNSLVDEGTKALQCMAMLCSVLKYYGQVAVGVARIEDRDLMIKVIDDASLSNPRIKERIHIVQFSMRKPANLPFHLLAWAQNYVKWYNCEGRTIFPNPNEKETRKASDRRLLGKHKRNDVETSAKHHTGNNSGRRGSKLSALAYSEAPYAHSDIYSNYSDAYRICSISLDRHHIGGPLLPIYHRRALIHRHEKEIHPNDQSDTDIYRNDDFFNYKDKTTVFKETRDGQSHQYEVPINYFAPMRYVYYSECDQTVHYDSMTTFEALTAASNDTTFFTGKRREKDGTSAPEDYLGSLNIYRHCGQKGYSLRWPKDHVVRHDG